MGAITGKGQADHAVDDIDRGRSQVDGFIGEAQALELVEALPDLLQCDRRPVCIRSPGIGKRNIGVEYFIEGQDTILIRIIDQPDGTAARNTPC